MLEAKEVNFAYLRGQPVINARQDFLPPLIKNIEREHTLIFQA